MSYRIYLNILDTKKFIKYLNCVDDYSYFSLKGVDENLVSVEIMDSLDLGKFEVIDKFKEDEYAPYMLSKVDFKGILNFYKESQLKMTEDFLKEIAEDKIIFSETENIKDTEIFWNLHRFSSFLRYLQQYMRKLLEGDVEIADSGYFTLQYFYLVELYKNLKDTDIVVITHG